VSALIDATVAAYGRLDCAVNNAGLDLAGELADGSEQDFDALMAVNAKGVFLCMKHEVRCIRETGGGAIVNVSSVSRLRTTKAQGLYGTSKAAVTYMTKATAAEVGKQRIRVNEIAPALLMSDMVRQYFEQPEAVPLAGVIARLALDHVGSPEDGARAALFLCSDAASYITGGDARRGPQTPPSVRTPRPSPGRCRRSHPPLAQPCLRTRSRHLRGSTASRNSMDGPDPAPPRRRAPRGPPTGTGTVH
jgi:NAD(P)-dependent dehydrogenase (short-subunit alcohol dehydrogenase family)